ncbi:MAG: rod shape-determining protein MreC [Acidobacteriia bacterium]|jgi:rod shape-determining protein MreC|nr:rod shape-determining protein MreC [Terriglobia bacterium]
MLPITSRHRPLVVLAATLLAQVLLLAVQIKRDQDVRLIRVWAVRLITPVQDAASWTWAKLTGAWQGYVALRGTYRENQALHQENQQLKLRLAQLEARAAEAERLAALLDFRHNYPDYPMVFARVIGASVDRGSRIFFIDRGSSDGLAKAMPVITPDGVVGRVEQVFAGTAQVLLLTDKESGVGAMLETSRTQGVIRGSGAPTLTLDYIVNEQPVAVGERVLTSGQDRIFPKGLPIGTVLQVEPGTELRSPFQKIVVRPSARLDQLEEVIVLLSREELVPAEPRAALPAESRPAGPPQ